MVGDGRERSLMLLFLCGFYVIFYAVNHKTHTQVSKTGCLYSARPPSPIIRSVPFSVFLSCCLSSYLSQEALAFCTTVHFLPRPSYHACCLFFPQTWFMYVCVLFLRYGFLRHSYNPIPSVIWRRFENVALNAYIRNMSRTELHLSLVSFHLQDIFCSSLAFFFIYIRVKMSQEARPISKHSSAARTYLTCWISSQLCTTPHCQSEIGI